MTSYYDSAAHCECCVYCQRWLVCWKPGQSRGTEPFDLAARAGVTVIVPFGPVPETARCLRWLCRLRGRFDVDN